jgi:endonuclease III related protein
MSRVMKEKLLAIYQHLLVTYGRQAWWPAESAFEIMLGAILTQNTNWLNVEKALAQLKQISQLTAEELLALPNEKLAACLKPAGYFRIKTRRVLSYCSWYLSQGGYEALTQLATACLRDALLKIHGIGPETADDILLYAFHRPVFVIDAYTRRLLQRLHFITGDEHYETLRALFESNLPRQVDLYQQFHALIVVHAKARCLKTKPHCTRCALEKMCFYSISVSS